MSTSLVRALKAASRRSRSSLIFCRFASWFARLSTCAVRALRACACNMIIYTVQSVSASKAAVQQASKPVWHMVQEGLEGVWVCMLSG